MKRFACNGESRGEVCADVGAGCFLEVKVGAFSHDGVGASCSWVGSPADTLSTQVWCRGQVPDLTLIPARLGALGLRRAPVLVFGYLTTPRNGVSARAPLRAGSPTFLDSLLRCYNTGDFAPDVEGA